MNIIPRAAAQVFKYGGEQVVDVTTLTPEALATRVNYWINWIMGGLIAFAVVEILLAGFTFMGVGAKGGKDAPAAAAQAKTRVIYAAVALGLAVVAKSAPIIVANLLKAGGQ